MSLRIIAGEFRGRRIQAPPGRRTRPTRDAVREAWFSALGDRVSGSRVLDLFAGSGALGLEALSRGARRVCFVESNRKALAVLNANIERLAVTERTEVRPADAFVVVAELAHQDDRSWDIVLADPPYSSRAARRLVSDFVEAPFADILCVEHAPRVGFDTSPDWQRFYGETGLSIFLDPAEGAMHG